MSDATAELDALLETWAALRPAEIERADPKQFYEDWTLNTFNAAHRDAYDIKLDGYPSDMHVLQGHAIDCIVREGYTFEIMRYDDITAQYHVTAWDRADTHIPTVASADLHTALVKMRIAVARHCAASPRPT